MPPTLMMPPPASRVPEITDWLRFTADVLGQLDVVREFALLGLRFTGKVHGDKHECHAFDRPDEAASAFVNAATGVYYASGSGEKGNLIALAAKYGNFGGYKQALKHYAALAGMPLGRLPAHGGAEFVEATYDYHRADGTVAYRVWRKRLPNGKKKFGQAPPDGRGGWRYGTGCMEGVPRVPYRLPHFPEAEHAYLWFTEGEVAADALVALGLVATTNSQGADLPERDLASLVPCFAGKDVVVLPDNDDTGRKHARRVCRLLSGTARTVRYLELPGLPVKGDAVDWVGDGGTAEGLLALADACPEWTGEEAEGEAADADDDPASRDATLADVRRTLSADAWLWKGWIPTAALTLVAAEPGIGKTCELMDLHRRLIHGLPWPDGQPTPVVENPKVLWVVADNQHTQLCLVAAAYGIPDELIILNTTGDDPHGGTNLETTEQLADFESRATRHNVVWSVIDTITQTGDFKSQDSVDAKRQYKPLQEIAARHQAPILCVTHLNASGKALGRRALEKVRTAIYLSQPDPEQPDRRRLWVEKSFAEKPQPLGVTVGPGGYEYDNNPPVDPEIAAGPSRKGPAPVQLDAAKRFLAAFVGCRTVAIVDAIKAGEAADPPHHKNTILRAGEALGLIKNDQVSPKTWTAPPAA